MIRETAEFKHYKVLWSLEYFKRYRFTYSVKLSFCQFNAAWNEESSEGNKQQHTTHSSWRAMTSGNNLMFDFDIKIMKVAKVK